MERVLILIAYPGEQGDKNYAPEIENILQRWKKFFMSPIGGNWDPVHEICTFDSRNPIGGGGLMTTLSQINNVADYSVIVFCGHGGCTTDFVDAIKLPNGDLFKVSDLLISGSKPLRRTIIIDACRSCMDISRQMLFEQRSFSSQFQLDGEACKDFYNDIIMKQCSPHYELIQSTEQGECAYFSNNGESHYSNMFLTYINSETKNWLEKAQSADDGKIYYSFYAMNNHVSNGLKMYDGSPYEQHPQFATSDNTSCCFPLTAIWLPKEKELEYKGSDVQLLTD